MIPPNQDTDTRLISRHNVIFYRRSWDRDTNTAHRVRGWWWWQRSVRKEGNDKKKKKDTPPTSLKKIWTLHPGRPRHVVSL